MWDLAGAPLRYLIGADSSDVALAGREGEITEVPYDCDVLPARGIGVGYCNLLDESKTGNYGPYLADTETSAAYGERVVDPNGVGWLALINEQLGRRQSQGFKFIEWDNSDAYPLAAAVRAYDRAAAAGMGVLCKNPDTGSITLVAHEATVGIIVEQGAGDPAGINALRRSARKPDLPVWFVAFGNGGSWADRTADAARAYANMRVAYSSVGEYGNSIDITAPRTITETSMPATSNSAPWMDDVRASIGKYTDGSDVPRLAAEVAAAFPDDAGQAREASFAGPATAWCGIFVAAMLARHGIKPPYTPPGDNIGSWMYVDSYSDIGWGTRVPSGQEQPGDIAVFKYTNLHHVTFFDGDGHYIGGNQGNAVTRTTFGVAPTAFVRPPQASSVIARPAPAKVSTDFDRCVALVLQSEGGNDDDPNDPGGRTSRGITQGDWDAWRRSHPGFPSDVWQAPQDQIAAIYRQMYWDALSCDQLPSGVNYVVFDAGVLQGIFYSAKTLQGIVGTDVDGEIGPLTIATTQTFSASGVVAQFSASRLSYLQGLSGWSRYGNGWGARVARVRADALAMAASAPAPLPTDPIIIPPKPPVVIMPDQPTLPTTAPVQIVLPSVDQLIAIIQRAEAALPKLEAILLAYQSIQHQAATGAPLPLPAPPIAVAPTPAPAASPGSQTHGLIPSVIAMIGALMAAHSGVIAPPVGAGSTLAGLASVLVPGAAGILSAFGQLAPILKPLYSGIAGMLTKQ